MVEGKEETAITAIWVSDGIDRCRVGFVPRHMVRHAARYDGALAQVTRVFSSNPETCDSTERRLFFKNKGYCRATIISTLPGSIDIDPLLTILEDIAHQAILDRLQLAGRTSQCRLLLRPKDLVQAIDFAHPLRRPLRKIGGTNTQF
jgi:hypothetical protein